jgi:Delta14-sterol reductase
MPFTLDARRLLTAALLFFGFVAALFLASLALPGRLTQGVTLADGTRPRYTLNGFAVFLVTAALTAASLFAMPGALAAVHDHFLPLLVVANAFAFTLSIYLTIKGRRASSARSARSARSASAGSSPAPPRGAFAFVRDCFYGVEIGPTFLGVDLKLFSYRPSLIGLGLINVSFAVVQYRTYGSVSDRMWLYQAFYFAYLFNYFQFEYGMIYTWDLIAERFGWMLVWGDYVLVPFFYSIPGWYLIHDRSPLPAWQAAALIALYVFGFVLFRGANEQKHRFKADPSARIWGRPAEAIGGKLLASGFWGVGRKLNYTGELCMYYAWSLLTGFDSVIPYLLPLWLTVFFPHRALRDEARCKAKYGELWTAYCKKAKFRMIPLLF